MKPPNVSLVIPSYNGKDFTVNLLKSLRKTKYKNYEIIVVDNGSSDGCYEYVKDRFPYVKAIKIKINRGVTGGLNAGIRQSRGKYIVVMNNDMIVDPNWLSELVKVADSDEKFGVVGCTFLEFGSSKKPIIQRAGHVQLNKIILKFKKVGEGEPYKNQFPEVLEVDHAFGLIKREVFDKAGLFDEKIFMSWDEVDLCHRARKFGYKTVVATKSKIFHLGHATVRKSPYIWTFHFHKNRIRFIMKNLSLFRKIVNLPLTVTYYLFESGFYLLKGDSESSRAIIDGIVWNVKNFRDYL